jgi:transcriptional regulator with XRE-family HTH domain
MNLGHTIKNLRKQKRLTQSAFAKKCGITQTYLSQIENNHKEPNLSTLKDISKVLTVPLPIVFFLSLDEKDIPPSKRDGFEVINPSIKSLVNAFFSL